MQEAADVPRHLALVVADPDKRKQPPRVEDRRSGVVRRMGQYDDELHEIIARQPDERVGSL